jgi:hypothetical protein
MKAMKGRIWIGIWLLLAAGLGMAAECSPEAADFHERLGRHNREADYRAMVEWVFQKDTAEETRRQRAGEAVRVLTEDPSRHIHGDDKEVWADDFLSRLEKEAGDQWWAWSAAGDLLSELNGSGERVDGKFVRRSRGDISSHARDAARMRQCYVKAMTMAEKPEDRAEIGLKLAADFDEGAGAEVLALTDLAVLPEISDESPRGKWSWDADDFLVDGRSPVIGPDGRWRLPVLRERFEDAKTDYERVFWLLNEAGRISPAHAARAKLALAEMWNELLGVHGLVSAGYVYIEGTSEPAADGECELATLKDEETIVIGVNGPERRTVPAECRAVTMLRELAEDAGTPADLRGEALERLTEILADRYQFDAMKEIATEVAARYPEVGDASDYLVNIGPDGRFATCESFIVGEEVAVTFISREISEQRFELWRMDVEKYVAENGSQTLRGFDSGPWGASARDFEKYQPFFQRVADWTAPVKRRGNHLQSATRIQVPVTEAGNYLVVTRLGDRWEVLPVQVARTIVLSAALDARFDDDGPDTWDSAGEADLFLIDALSGEPVEGAVAVAGHGRSEAISDHTGFLLGMGGGGEVLVRRAGLSPELLEVEDGELDAPEGDEIRSFLVTNQPLYRPGQRVDYAGWLKRPNGRSAKSDRFEEGAEVKVKVKVTDPVGQVIHEIELALDEFGGFAGSFTLASEMVLGDCFMDLAVGFPSSEDPFADKSKLEMEWDELDRSWRIQVGEFRKPDFRVEVEAAGGGDGIAAVVKASYHSGEAVKGAAVTARLRAYPTRSQVFPKLEWDDLYEAGYDWEHPRATWLKDWQSWGIWPQEDDWDNDDLYYGDEVVLDATGVTDDEGKARLVFPEKLPLLGHYEYDCSVRVGVQEFTGRSVGAESDFTYSGREHEVLIQPERGFYREGETVKLQLWTMSAAREPVFGSGRVRVEAVAADGGLTEIWSEEVLTSEKGREEVEFEPPAAGQYRCVFAAGGGERGFLLEVIGDKPASGRYDGVQLTPSRAVGAVGDRVEVLIQTEEDEAMVWFFEQMPDGRKRTPRLIETRNRRAVVEVPLTKAGVPEFFLQAATVVKGRLKKATCRIVMPPVETKLNVTLSADPPRGEPGDEVKLAIAVKDAAGKPVEASLAVTAFDRALEDLGAAEGRILDARSVRRRVLAGLVAGPGRVAGRRVRGVVSTGLLLRTRRFDGRSPPAGGVPLREAGNVSGDPVRAAGIAEQHWRRVGGRSDGWNLSRDTRDSQLLFPAGRPGGGVECRGKGADEGRRGAQALRGPCLLGGGIADGRGREGACGLRIARQSDGVARAVLGLRERADLWRRATRHRGFEAPASPAADAAGGGGRRCAGDRGDGAELVRHPAGVPGHDGGRGGNGSTRSSGDAFSGRGGEGPVDGHLGGSGIGGFPVPGAEFGRKSGGWSGNAFAGRPPPHTGQGGGPSGDRGRDARGTSRSGVR